MSLTQIPKTTNPQDTPEPKTLAPAIKLAPSYLPQIRKSPMPQRHPKPKKRVNALHVKAERLALGQEGNSWARGTVLWVRTS